MRTHCKAQGTLLSALWQAKWGGNPKTGYMNTQSWFTRYTSETHTVNLLYAKKLIEKRNSCVLAHKWWVYRCFFYHQAFIITWMLHIFFWVWQILTDKCFTGLWDAILYWWSGKPPFEHRHQGNESLHHTCEKSILVVETGAKTWVLGVLPNQWWEQILEAQSFLFLIDTDVPCILHYFLTTPRSSKEIRKSH